MKHLLLFVLILLFSTNSTSLLASQCGPRVIVEFMESSPDYFTITNKSTVGWKIEHLTIDLGGSAGQVIFDTEFGGDGSSMPEHFLPLSGDVKLDGVSNLIDGDQRIKLQFKNFNADSTFEFFIDLDDRLEALDYNRADVTTAELSGTRVLVTLSSSSGQSVSLNGKFDTTGKALIGHGVCV